jgi:hypothetical protein
MEIFRWHILESCALAAETHPFRAVLPTENGKFRAVWDRGYLVEVIEVLAAPRDLERGLVGQRPFPLDRDVLDPGSRRPRPAPLDQSVDAAALPLENGLNRTVGSVADPA